MRLDADLRAPYRARKWITEMQIPLQAERTDVLVLLLTELVTASVKHALLTSHERLNLVMLAEEGVVRIEVTDPRNEDPPEVPPSPDHASGWGFYLVDKLADRWGVTHVRPPGLWFEMDVYRLEPGTEPSVTA
jgi:two-component sensor histidine kinase